MIHQSVFGHCPNRTLRVTLVGVGGNGSKMLIGLKNLHLALSTLGLFRLHVTAYDHDLVSESNLVRQSYYPSDIGQNKAVLLVNRINLSCGLAWEAQARAYNHNSSDFNADLLMSCVDTRFARAEIVKTLEYRKPSYWLDLGNDVTTGQYVLGQPASGDNKNSRSRLRTAVELFPSIADTCIPEDATPSCTTREALEKQDLFVNDILVAQALNLLWQLLFSGRLEHHGGFINAQHGTVSALPIDLKTWNRLARAAAQPVN